MAQSTFSVRMDDNLKKQFDFLCSDFGMTASTAFNIFARTVVRQRRIPFEITSDKAEITKADGYNAFMALSTQRKRGGKRVLQKNYFIKIWFENNEKIEYDIHNYGGRKVKKKCRNITFHALA